MDLRDLGLVAGMQKYIVAFTATIQIRCDIKVLQITLDLAAYNLASAKRYFNMQSRMEIIQKDGKV